VQDDRPKLAQKVAHLLTGSYLTRLRRPSWASRGYLDAESRPAFSLSGRAQLVGPLEFCLTAGGIYGGVKDSPALGRGSSCCIAKSAPIPSAADK
jgi:hypothetical protein